MDALAEAGAEISEMDKAKEDSVGEKTHTTHQNSTTLRKQNIDHIIKEEGTDHEEDEAADVTVIATEVEADSAAESVAFRTIMPN